MASGPFINESVVSNLDVIHLSVVRFHLVHSSVQATTWWRDESVNGLIDAEGGFIGLGDIFWPIGYL